MAAVWELRLHTVTGLPLQGTAIAVEAQLGDVTWRSAPAASHGGVAYIGAWVAVQPTVPELVLRVTDRGVAQCSGSGTVNAVGRLALRTKAEQAAAAGGAAAPAASAAPGLAGADDGWTHVELELEQGKAARLAKAVEEAIEHAAEAHEQAVLSRKGASGEARDGSPAGAGDAGTEGHRAETATATTAGGQQQADEPGAAAEAEQQRQQAAAQQASSPGLQVSAGPAAEQACAAEAATAPIDVVLSMPNEAAYTEDSTHVQQATVLRLSYRQLRPSPSAAFVAGTEAAPLPQAKPSLLRLLSRRPAKKAAAQPMVELAGKGVQGEPGQQPALSAEEVSSRLHLEVPVDPLPFHLHAYGHGAFMGAALSMGLNQQWRQILQREDPPAYKRASKVVIGLKLLHMGDLERGLTRAALALMPCLENNPVLAAYGAVRSGAARQVGAGAGAAAAHCAATSSAAPLPASDEAAGPGAGFAAGTVGLGEAEDAVVRGPAAAAAPAETEAGEAVLTDPAAAAVQSTAEAPQTAAPVLQGMEPASINGSQVPAYVGGSEAHATPAAMRAAAASAQRRADRAAADAMLADYLRSQRQPNKYGYLPIAQEWDIWVHPSAPADLQAAGVSHGSAAALVTQAVTSAMPCTRGCARSAGQSQITGQSLSPVRWLDAFGHAINAGVNGDRAAPLALAAEPQRWWRLRVTLHGATGVPVQLWSQPYVKGRVHSSAVLLPKAKTGRGGAAAPDAFTWARSRAFRRSSLTGSSSGGSGAELAFWPLPEGLGCGETLTLELRGDPAGIVSDSQVGGAVLPLGPLAERYPSLLAGEAVRLQLALTSPQEQRAAAATAAAAADASSIGGASGNATYATTAAPSGSSSVDEAAGAGNDGGAAGIRAVGSALQHGGQHDGQHDSEDAGSEGDDDGSPAWGSSASLAAAADASLAAVLAVQAADGSSLAPPGSATAGAAGAAQGPALDLELRLEPVSCLDALLAVGLPAAAAQTCLAMLAEPGGLYLDVKSAYSTPQDLMMFVSVLKGLGIHTKAVCSFQAKQLQIPPPLCRTVLFFHGVGGLEGACDAGQVLPGQFVLFNGASFLADLSPGGLQLPEDLAAQLLTGSRQHPVDAMVVRRYKGLVEQYGFAGGIYVQEPDTAASAAQALISLVTREERFFPLGFAYGHLRDAAVSVFDLAGRGFANQEILEELAARNAMSNKVVVSVKRGQHRGISTNVTITWARRLVTTAKLMSLREQRALLALLGQLPPGPTLLQVLDDLGGIQPICLRFFQHYEAYTPMTLLEAGFNVNHQKAFLRLLRNHGALAALPLHRKIALARFFLSRQLWGYGLTWLLMFARLRTGLHKHGKEGLLCLLESCTGEEYGKVLLALGGRLRLARMLRGRLRLSWHYVRRMQDVERTHATLGPHIRAYENHELKYAALPAGKDEEEGAAGGYLHTRDKTPGEKTLRALRKSSCCVVSSAHCFGLNILTLGFFTPCCLCPRILGATFKGTCSMGSVLAFILGLLAAIALYIMLAAVLPDAVD